ncbi:MAG: AI-2E family transporter [Halocynthiibacter sp.]
MSKDDLVKFQTITFATALAIMVVYILVVGGAIIRPIIMAVIAVYILLGATDALSKLPIFNKAPMWVHRFAVWFLFATGITFLSVMISGNIEQLIAKLPEYQKTILELVNRGFAMIGLEEFQNGDEIQDWVTSKIRITDVASTALYSLRTVGTTVFIIVLYASFLMSERTGFAKKVTRAFRSDEKAEQVTSIFEQVNGQIRRYLAMKTLINIMLGLTSYILLRILGIDFAFFWALLIALLNYIPYVGSMIGVAFPVMLTLMQFGSIWMTAVAAVVLTTAQIFFGNILEPRLIGNSVNMSPFIVLVALTFWYKIWGVQGAILAVPMTSMLMIIFASIGPTRWISILLSNKGQV